MKKSLRVLIIEDSEPDTSFLVRTLENEGFSVEFRRVANDADFRTALRDERWDVILSDYYLPSFTGTDAFFTLRSLGLDIPFLMISGVIGDRAATPALRAGVLDFVSKDNLSRLAPAIERELRAAVTRRHLRAVEAKLGGGGTSNPDHAAPERLLIDELRLLQAMVDSLGVAMVASDSEGRLLYWNPAAERLIPGRLSSASAAEWIQRERVALSDGVTPLTLVESPLERAAKGETVIDFRIRLRPPHAAKDLLLSIDARPLRDREGNGLGAVALFYELTGERAEVSRSTARIP